MQELATLTTLINLLALASSLWLGFYVVTRSPRSALSWLASLTLWSISGYFLHNAIAINLPNSGVLTWLRQTVVVILPLWFHLTALLLPAGSTTSPTRVRIVLINRVGVPLAYAIAMLLIVIDLFTRDLLTPIESRAAILTSSRAPGPAYPFFTAFLALIFIVTFINLWYGRAHTPDARLKRRFDSLLVATVLAGLGGLYISVGTLLQLDLPLLPGDVGLGAGVALLGFAVARYAALLEGRPMDRDFVYAILVVGSLTALYVLVVYILFLGGHLSFLTLVLTIVGTISANSLFDGVRIALDRIFYRGQFQQLRANLRALAREAGTGQTLPEHLQAILDTICRALRIKKGFVALEEQGIYRVAATHEGNALGETFPLNALAASETVGVMHPAKKGLHDMTLLIPLFGGARQIGAVVLGMKESREAFTEEDLNLLEDLADQIAGVIHALQAQAENAQTINGLVDDFRQRERALQLQVQQILSARQEEPKPILQDVNEEELEHLVEDGLRRLHDYAYLGEQPLAQLRVVAARVKAKEGGITFMDRGKAVSETLAQALNQLRPDGAEPDKRQVPPREWHQFIILHDSYVEESPNRDIMSRLYISEGTFNRTRRRALKAVAKSLQEMEQEAEKMTNDK